MIRLRYRAVLLLPALGFGCFLDEAPDRDGLTSSSATEARERGAKDSDSASTPMSTSRDPGTSSARSEKVDAGQTPVNEPADAAVPAQAMDAAVQTPSTVPRLDSGTAAPQDAHVRDPQGPVSAPAMDAAQVALEAGAPPQGAPNAQDAAQVAADAQPPTAADAGASQAAPPKPIHRYDFVGNGRTAVDLIGGQDAALRGNTFLDARGSVQLGPSTDDSVELPDPILAGLTSFTLLGWMEPRPQDCWRRLFDFVYYREGEGDRGGQGGPRGNEGRDGRETNAQVSALYLTPNACPDNIPSVGYVTESSQLQVDGRQGLSARQVLLGAAYDSSSGALQLIVDGVVVAQQNASISLPELSVARGSLGKPTDAEDQRVNGSISEFRVYDRTLDAATLAEIARRGPDQL